MTTRAVKDQAYLTRILENSPDGIFTINFDLCINYVNSTFCRLVGFTEQELIGSSIVEYLGDMEILSSCMASVETTGRCNDQETVFRRRDGSFVHIAKNVQAISDDNGVVTEILVMVRDLTKLHDLNRELALAKQALQVHADNLEIKLSEREEALYIAKERAEVTLASIGDAVITTDECGRVTFINSVAEQLTGWLLNEALMQPLSRIFNIINEETRNRVENPVDSVLRDGKTVMLANHTILIAKNGQEFNIEDSAAPIFMPDGTLIGCVLVFHDVTDKHKLQKSIQWQALHDVLTGLPNRVLLADRFSRALVRAERHQAVLVVCMIDLDGFKPINDQYGHEVGDRLLVEVANRLVNVVRGDDTVSRLGGDEFVLLLSLEEVEQLQTVMERVLNTLSEPFDIAGKKLTLSASIGISLYPMDDADADTLLRHADQAMYLAKQRGRNQWQIFDHSLDKQIMCGHHLQNKIRAALSKEHEFILHYQPKVNMRTGNVVGMEALLRWSHPEEGMLFPLDFLPQIEKTELMIDLCVWVLNKALDQLAEWVNAGKSWALSINIAAVHFNSGKFYQHLQSALMAHPDVLPSLLEIEIVESVALADVERVKRVMQDCQALGVRFSLDDFGTGYSSLTYLKHLPAETIKIDKSFVHNLSSDSDNLMMVGAIVNMGNVFKRSVIAEGVESREQGELLMQLGCDLAQGYAIAKAMPAENVLSWVEAYESSPYWGRA